MSKQALAEFRTKVLEDATLRSEMSKKLGPPDTTSPASVDELVLFAKSHGYDIDASDVREGIELSDDELEAVAGGASDYLLEIDGIKGETRAHKHKEWIDVLSFNFVKL